jgi:hypothetical protein
MWQLNLNPGKFGAADPFPDPELYPDSEWEWDCTADLRLDIFPWAKSYQIEANEDYINKQEEGNCMINSYMDDNELRKIGIEEMTSGRCPPLYPETPLSNGPGDGDYPQNCLGEEFMTDKETEALQLEDYEEYILSEKYARAKGSLETFCGCPDYPKSYDEMIKYLGNSTVSGTQIQAVADDIMKDDADESTTTTEEEPDDDEDIDQKKTKFLWRGRDTKDYTPESQMKAIIWVSDFKWRLRC